MRPRGLLPEPGGRRHLPDAADDSGHVVKRQQKTRTIDGKRTRALPKASVERSSSSLFSRSTSSFAYEVHVGRFNAMPVVLRWRNLQDWQASAWLRVGPAGQRRA